MKKIILLSSFLVSLVCFGQVPQGISYQAIALNGSGAPVVSANVGLRLSIIDNSATGTVLYTETHVKTTNAQGLYNLVIGQGTPTTGTFSAINWGTNSKFLKVEMDAAGGTNYTLVGSTQLLSVPYALYAGKVDSENVIGSADDTNADTMSFMTSTDAHVYSATSIALLSPYSWFSTPISGTPLLKSYNTFVTSSNVYMLARVGSNYQWVTTAIVGQPLKVYSSSPQNALIITSTNAYLYNYINQSFVSVAIDGSFVDYASNGILTSTHAYVYAPDTSFTGSSWYSLPISGTPLKVKYNNLDGGTLFLTSTNAYIYGPDTTSSGPATEINYSWKTISLSSSPVLD